MEGDMGDEPTLFEMTDGRKMTGICCLYGSGYYKIKINGENRDIIGGAFGSSVWNLLAVGEPFDDSVIINSVDYIVAVKRYDRWPETAVASQAASGNVWSLGGALISIRQQYADGSFRSTPIWS
jgi:hypothetical protein